MKGLNRVDAPVNMLWSRSRRYIVHIQVKETDSVSKCCRQFYFTSYKQQKLIIKVTKADSLVNSVQRKRWTIVWRWPGSSQLKSSTTRQWRLAYPNIWDKQNGEWGELKKISNLTISTLYSYSSPHAPQSKSYNPALRPYWKNIFSQYCLT